MKLTDIPKHVIELPNVPFFFREFYRIHKISIDELEDIKPLYHLDYWVGPLSGIFECKGHIFYGKAVYYMDRQYWACWELNKEQQEIRFARYKLFQENVGEHTDYEYDEENGWKRTLGKGLKPRELSDNFYKNKDIPDIDYDDLTKGDIFGIVHNPFRN